MMYTKQNHAWQKKLPIEIMNVKNTQNSGLCPVCLCPVYFLSVLRSKSHGVWNHQANLCIIMLCYVLMISSLSKSLVDLWFCVMKVTTNEVSMYMHLLCGSKLLGVLSLHPPSFRFSHLMFFQGDLSAEQADMRSLGFEIFFL
jgi:hypothetical protein